MVALLLILDKNLSKEQTEKMLKIAGRANLNASGARPSGDRIKIAGILAKAALFSRDKRLVEEVLSVIEGEIKFAPDEKQQLNAEGRPTGERVMFQGTGRGLQYDYSFHHRSDRVNNTLSYGTGYADAFAEWAEKVADTRYSFSDSSLKLLTDYYLDGICKQMIYSSIPDPGVKNRDITRPGSGRPMSSVTPQRLLNTGNYRRAELEEVVRARKGEKVTPHSFAKFFWQTEHFVFQRPGFYTSVRMYSVRNRNMEQPYNGEGLTNHYRADGTNHISLRGDEYNNIAPLLDWRKIPGATIIEGEKMPPENEIQKNGLTGFVGGVTDGLYGAAAFDFISPHDNVRAKKSWFFFDNEYICLGAGIQCENRENAVTTTLNQCWLNGDVTIKDTKGISVLAQGVRAPNKVSWIHHDGIGYVFPKVEMVNLSNGPVSGTWYSVNRQTSSSKEVVTKNTFKLWLDHGIRPSDGSYAYIVIPGAKITDVESYAADPSFEILTNSTDLQAVYNKKTGLGYAVFYKAGTIRFPEDINIWSDTPGMLMIRFKENRIQSITVSDPSRSLNVFRLKVNRKIDQAGEKVRISWDDKNGISDIDIELPSGKFTGSSTTLTLE
jgi:chondroitin AC lyase